MRPRGDARVRPAGAVFLKPCQPFWRRPCFISTRTPSRRPQKAAGTRSFMRSRPRSTRRRRMRAAMCPVRCTAARTASVFIRATKSRAPASATAAARRPTALRCSPGSTGGPFRRRFRRSGTSCGSRFRKGAAVRKSRTPARARRSIRAGSFSRDLKSSARARSSLFASDRRTAKSSPAEAWI